MKRLLLSIPFVSDSLRGRAYPSLMKEKTALGWGGRFRELLKAKGSNLAAVAEKLERAESSVRSWTNGTREINLGEFVELCDAAGLDPCFVLFASPSHQGKPDKDFLAIQHAWEHADSGGKELLQVAAEAAERLSDTNHATDKRKSTSKRH